VSCNLTKDEKFEDSKIVRCVLKWYWNNPLKSFELFYNKSVYYWSPWIGPNAEGTSGRNPWLRYGPVAILSNNIATEKIIEGSIGKLVSALWQILCLFFLLFGLIRIYKLGILEEKIVIVSTVILLINWGICLLTIGDNRFRIPISGISIFLQAAGVNFLFRKKQLNMSLKDS
jgi:hypothetical protein